MSAIDHDPRRVYAKLAELYEEAHRVHVASGNALVEIINALSRKAEADGAFLDAFAHLVPQPLPEAQAATAHDERQPLPRGFGRDAATHAQAHEHAQPLPAGPPPLGRHYGQPVPDLDDEERDERYRRWMEAVQRRGD